MNKLVRFCLVQFVLLASVHAAIVIIAGAARAQEQPVVDCVVAAYYPPYLIADAEQNAGMSIEILREAARRAGRRIDIQFMPFQRALLTLKTNSRCMIPTLFRVAGRERQYMWIVDYDSSDLRFLTTSVPIDTLDDGRRLTSIGVETDSFADQYLTRIGFENLVRVSATTSSARMLSAGRIDAWVQSRPAASRLWEELNLAPALQVGASVYSVPVYLAAGLNFSQDIALEYEAAVTEMLADGTVRRIIDKYK